MKHRFTVAVAAKHDGRPNIHNNQAPAPTTQPERATTKTATLDQVNRAAKRVIRTNDAVLRRLALR